MLNRNLRFAHPQKSYGNPVVVAIHRFLGANRRFEAQNSARAERQSQFNAMLPDGLEIADTQHFTEAIHNAEVRLR